MCNFDKLDDHDSWWFQGFDVDGDSYPGSILYRTLFPIELDEPFECMFLPGLTVTGREFMKTMVDLALERYNMIKVWLHKFPLGFKFHG